jgi:hypothetical protein
MSRLIRSFFPAVCLIALVVFAFHPVKADDTATTQPSDAATQPSAVTGSIAVTVLDSDSKPVVKARLNLYAKKKPAAEDGDAAPVKAKAIAKGRTDEDGKFTFEDVAAGEYRVSASLKSAGTKGSETVSVTSDALNPEVTITMSAPSTDSGGGATTAPATPPAQ